MKFIRLMILSICLMAGIASNAQSIPKWKVTELRKYYEHSDSVLVINFWATFCKPCIKEIPYYQSITQKYQGNKVKLLLVSLDISAFYPDRIRTFAVKNNYTSQIVWLDETNADYFCPKVDKNWSGAIPSTLMINPHTGYKKFYEKQMKAEEFEAELQKAIKG